MKKLLTYPQGYAFLTVLALILCAAGCESEASPNAEPSNLAFIEDSASSMKVFVFEHKAHIYLASNTGGMLHAQCCPCLNKPQ